MDWLKDKTRLEEEESFPDETIRQELIYEIEGATTRKKCIKEQKKVGESLITTSFQVQLKASGQWDRWAVELESNLKMIVGAQGIILSYVIRENDTPDNTEGDTCEEKVVFAVSLNGRLYKQDNLTVHNIILRYIADASGSFTYMKPYIKH